MVPDDFHSVFMSATVSVTTLAASGNALREWPTREALVRLAEDRGLSGSAALQALEMPRLRFPAFSADAANPLRVLPMRAALVLLGRAAGLPMIQMAEALSISRQRAHQLLRRARTALEPIAASRTVVD